MPEAFKKIPQIQYEGPQSMNPLAFKHYNPEEVVEGKTMRDHLRFSVVYWHTMCGNGTDMFGWGTFDRPWDLGTVAGSLERAKRRVPVFFEFCEKLDAPFYASEKRTRLNRPGLCPVFKKQTYLP